MDSISNRGGKEEEEEEKEKKRNINVIVVTRVKHVQSNEWPFHLGSSDTRPRHRKAPAANKSFFRIKRTVPSRFFVDGRAQRITAESEFPFTMNENQLCNRLFYRIPGLEVSPSIAQPYRYQDR